MTVSRTHIAKSHARICQDASTRSATIRTASPPPPTWRNPPATRKRRDATRASSGGSSAISTSARRRPGLTISSSTREGTPALLLGQQDRVGSLRRGCDADFAVFDGDPLDLGVPLRAVWIDGQRRFGTDPPPAPRARDVAAGKVAGPEVR